MNVHAAGQRIGHLELMELLGEGGFAEVWKARRHGALGFSREVAVKLLRPERVGDPEVLRALLQEAALCAELEHDHIVQVHDVFEHDGTMVVEMELLGGGTLEHVIDTLRDFGLRVPKSVVLAIGVQVCAGLHHAWTGLRQDRTPFRVVHRDLKPANLLFTAWGKVCIADFGLAKRTDDMTMSASGEATLKGTPRYVAPETLTEDKPPPSPTMDMFALGCVLYEAAMGHPVNAGENLHAVIHQVLMGEPEEQVEPLRRQWPVLADLVEELLDRNPTRRPGDPAAVGDRLAELRAERPQDPGLSVFMELLRSVEHGAAPPPPLATDDPDWLALWNLAELHGGSTVVTTGPIADPDTAPAPSGAEPAASTAEPIPSREPATAPSTPAPETDMVMETASEPVLAPLTSGPIVFESGTDEVAPTRTPTRAPTRSSARPPSPAEPTQRRSLVLPVFGGIVVVLLLLIAGVALLPSSESEPAPAPAPTAAGDRACLVLGSDPAGAVTWLDGVQSGVAGDAKGAPRWASAGEHVVGMGGTAAPAVTASVLLEAGVAHRIVCAVSATPSCLVAKMPAVPCE